VLVLYFEGMDPHLQLAWRIRIGVLSLSAFAVGPPLRTVIIALVVFLLVLHDSFQHAVVLTHQLHL
jgi:hypothetical protein